MNQSKSKLEDDVDALFRLPLTEFISARKTLAARLKKEGHGDQASRVKALVKPSISAWAVNQLYWQHREAFDRLIATGQNFRRAQSSRLAGKVADMREALDARREALSELSTLATTVLRDAVTTQRRTWSGASPLRWRQCPPTRRFQITPLQAG